MLAAIDPIMPEGGRGRDESTAAWAEHLQLIASRTRLRILALLSEPRTLSELENHVEPEVRLRGGSEAEPGTPPPEDHPVAREPITLEGSIDDASESAPPSWETPASGAPSLTIVHGDPLGRSYELAGEPEDPHRGWVIGYGEEADIRLRDDQRAGGEAGDIERSEGAFRLVDLRTADRRVSVNGQALARGETHELEDGDLVGVGRVLLHFRVG